MEKQFLFRLAFQQIIFLHRDISKQIGNEKLRLLTFCLSRSFWGIMQYRVERAGSSMFGPGYRFIRLPFIPIFNLIQAYSNIEIPFRADIKGALQIFHPSAGVVISQFAEIGEHFCMAGMSSVRENSKRRAPFRSTTGASRGANVLVLGPIHIAKFCRIGASACVIHSCQIEGTTLAGVPAKLMYKTNLSNELRL